MANDDQQGATRVEKAVYDRDKYCPPLKRRCNFRGVLRNASVCILTYIFENLNTKLTLSLDIIRMTQLRRAATKTA